MRPKPALGLLGIFGLSLIAAIYHALDTPQTLLPDPVVTLYLKDGIVQLKADNSCSDGGITPAQTLAAALRDNQKSRLFRVSWNCEGGSTSMGPTAIYDRSQKTLRLFSVGGMYSTHDPAQVAPRHYLYTGVTETILQRLAYKYAGYRDARGLFDQLPSFGCRKRVLKP